jgi:hypothetical protein
VKCQLCAGYWSTVEGTSCERERCCDMSVVCGLLVLIMNCRGIESIHLIGSGTRDLRLATRYCLHYATAKFYE